MRRASHNYETICLELGIHRNTFLNWRRSVNYEDPIERISDEDLDVLLFDHIEEHGRDGEKLLAGYIRSQGYRVTMDQIRASVYRVDPEGPIRRLSEVIPRREYVSRGPMDCVHIDGNHKLIRWKLVIHGGIDGCTREIIFLKCSDNNRAQAVFAEFLRGCIEYDVIPMATRTDYGGENILIFRFMDHVVGNGREARTGDSQANQRIEQLWRWVTEKVSMFYINAFWDMEQLGMNIEDPETLFCLHYLFVPRICEDLQRFRSTWLYHKMRTAPNNASPRELYMKHADLLPEPAGNFDIHHYAATFQDATDYAVEYQQVILEPSRSPLTITQFDAFKQRVRPLTLEDKKGSFLYHIDCALRTIRHIEATVL
jgi:hypothetical protein